MFYLISKSRKPITTNSHLKFLPKICWTFFSHELLSDFGGACGRLKRRRRGVPQICTLLWRLKRSPEKEPASPSVADHRSWLLTTSNLPPPIPSKQKEGLRTQFTSCARNVPSFMMCKRPLFFFQDFVFFFVANGVLFWPLSRRTTSSSTSSSLGWLGTTLLYLCLWLCVCVCAR